MLVQLVLTGNRIAIIDEIVKITGYGQNRIDLQIAAQKNLSRKESGKITRHIFLNLMHPTQPLLFAYADFTTLFYPPSPPSILSNDNSVVIYYYYYYDLGKIFSNKK